MKDESGCDKAGAPRRLAPSQQMAMVVALIAAIGPAVLWPGDAPWVYDEPAEVRLALQANQQHRLADHALSGNFWVWYGPLPIQIMQGLLLVSHDPRWLVVMRGSLYALITCGALLWLGRTLRLNLWFVAALMLAPHLWLWNRQLWAAYLAVPVSALCVAAHASFLRSGRGAALATAIGSAIALPLIHPQGLPLTVVILIHLLWRHRPALWKHWIPVVAVMSILALLNAKYVIYAGAAVVTQLGSSVHAAHPSETNRATAFFGALMGGRLICTDEFNETPLKVQESEFTKSVEIVGLIGIPLVWMGIGYAGWILASRRISDLNDPVHRLMFGLLLAGIAVQAIYFAALRVPPRPYYFFGMFGLNALAAWMGSEALARLKLGTAVLCLYAGALGFSCLGTQWLVHRDGWPANQISPTLNEQIAVVQKLNEYSDREAWTNISTYRDHEVANALWGLRLLYPRIPDQSLRQSRGLLIRYKTGAGGRATGRIELIELEAGVAPPADAKQIALQYPDQ